MCFRWVGTQSEDRKGCVLERRAVTAHDVVRYAGRRPLAVKPHELAPWDLIGRVHEVRRPEDEERTLLLSLMRRLVVPVEEFDDGPLEEHVFVHAFLSRGRGTKVSECRGHREGSAWVDHTHCPVGSCV